MGWGVAFDSRKGELQFQGFEVKDGNPYEPYGLYLKDSVEKEECGLVNFGAGDDGF
jgi:hypothetical protein